jgi:hypothetical protein
VEIIISFLMKNFLLKAIVILVGAGCLIYAGDYAVFHYRVARNLSPFDTVTVNAYYAVPQKTGKMEYDFQSSQQETCANALFPHMGYVPCWFGRRHADRKIQL